MSKLTVNELLKILKILKEDKIKKKRKKRKYKKKGKRIDNNVKSSSDHMLPSSIYTQSPNLNTEIQREQLKGIEYDNKQKSLIQNAYQHQIDMKNGIVEEPFYIDTLNRKIDSLHKKQIELSDNVNFLDKDMISLIENANKYFSRSDNVDVVENKSILHAQTNNPAQTVQTIENITKSNVPKSDEPYLNYNNNSETIDDTLISETTNDDANVTNNNNTYEEINNNIVEEKDDDKDDEIIIKNYYTPSTYLQYIRENKKLYKQKYIDLYKEDPPGDDFFIYKPKLSDDVKKLHEQLSILLYKIDEFNNIQREIDDEKLRNVIDLSETENIDTTQENKENDEDNETINSSLSTTKSFKIFDNKETYIEEILKDREKFRKIYKEYYNKEPHSKTLNVDINNNLTIKELHDNYTKLNEKINVLKENIQIYKIDLLKKNIKDFRKEYRKKYMEKNNVNKDFFKDNENFTFLSEPLDTYDYKTLKQIEINISKKINKLKSS